MLALVRGACCCCVTQALKKSGKDIEDRITRQEFLEYCKHDPDVRSWLFFYDDPDDAMDFTWRLPEPLNLENPSEGVIEDRTPAQIAVTEPEYFVESGMYTLMGGPEDPDEPVFPDHPWRTIADRTKPDNPPRVPKTYVSRRGGRQAGPTAGVVPC